MNNVERNLRYFEETLDDSQSVIEKNREAWKYTIGNSVNKQDKVIERTREWIRMNPDIYIHSLAIAPLSAFTFVWYRVGEDGLDTRMALISMHNYIEWPTVHGVTANFPDQDELIRQLEKEYKMSANEDK